MQESLLHHVLPAAHPRTWLDCCLRYVLFVRQAHDKRRQDSESAAAAATAIAAEADAAGTQPAGSEGGNVYRLAPSHVPEATAAANGHSVAGAVCENGGINLGAPAARPNVSAACCRRQARRRKLQ